MGGTQVFVTFAFTAQSWMRKPPTRVPPCQEEAPAIAQAERTKQANMDERKVKWRPQERASASGPTQRHGAALRSLVFQTHGRLGGEGTKLLRDLVTTAAADGQCSPHAAGRWTAWLDRVLVWEPWDPGPRSVPLLSLLCGWQSSACRVVRFFFGGPVRSMQGRMRALCRVGCVLYAGTDACSMQGWMRALCRA